MTVTATKLLYTRKEAAAALAMSERQLDILLAHGDILAKRQGRMIKVERAELERFIKKLPAHEPGQA